MKLENESIKKELQIKGGEINSLKSKLINVEREMSSKVDDETPDKSRTTTGTSDPVTLLLRELNQELRDKNDS